VKDVERVAWTEGMLMCPQHLQQQDLYHERTGALRLDAALPYSFGVVTLALDAGALGAGEVKVTEFSGILPDGTPLAFRPGSRDAPAARSLEGHLRPGATEPLEVFLGLPIEREGAASFEEAERVRAQFPPRARYTLTAEMTKDLTGAARPTEITYGRRNVVILFGDEPREDFSLIKVAEITRNGVGQPMLIDMYVPPCLRVSASPMIMGGLARLLNVLTGKYRELASQHRERDASSVEFGPSDVTRYLQLTAVGGLVPVFAHLARAGDVGPRELYLLMAQAAGGLMSFTPGADPAELPAFSYTDLRETFEALFAMLTALLKQTVREAAVPIPLMVKNGVLFGRMEGEPAARCKKFLLAVRAEGIPEEQLIERLPGLSKIASWKQIQRVVQIATPGVPIKVTHRPPPEIAVKAGTLYFVIDTENSYWREILEERGVALYFPPPFDPARVKTELFGIPGRDA
jgi:type VI secretion system protein ImpJ